MSKCIVCGGPVRMNGMTSAEATSGGVATEGLREAIDDIDAAIGSDPNYGDGPRLHRKAALALSLLESVLSTTPPAPEATYARRVADEYSRVVLKAPVDDREPGS